MSASGDLILEITLCLGHLSSLKIKYHSTSLGSDSRKGTVSVRKHDKISISTSFLGPVKLHFQMTGCKWQRFRNCSMNSSAACGAGAEQVTPMSWRTSPPQAPCSSTSALGSQGGTLAWICRHAKEWSLSPEKLPAINYNSNSKHPSPITELASLVRCPCEGRWEDGKTWQHIIVL